MFKKPTKKQLLIRRIALLALATASVVIILVTTILFMLGYRLDAGLGKLEQGALLQFDSKPGGATVTVDDTKIGTTATKATFLSGMHTVSFTKNGYQNWSRTLELTAGTLTWLDYIRLVPSSLPVQSLTTYGSLESMRLSPDGKWALVHEKSDSANFSLVDLRSEDIKTAIITLPAASYSEADKADVTHTFSLQGWDESSRYVIVKHTYKTQTEWLVVDTQNSAQTINVTQTLGVATSQLIFAGSNGRILYGLTDDGTLRKLDLSAKTLSRALITHVTNFGVFDDKTITYVGTDANDATRFVAGIYRDGDDTPTVLRTSAKNNLLITAGHYFSDDYVALSEDAAVTVLKGKFPTGAAQADANSLARLTSFNLPGAATNLSFSPRSDYIIAQSATNFASYEIEHNRTAGGALTTNNGQAAYKLDWLDGSHLWSDDENTLTMRDFNGSNAYKIMSVASGYDAGLSQNGRFFYAIGQSKDGYHLQRVKMILD